MFGKNALWCSVAAGLSLAASSLGSTLPCEDASVIGSGRHEPVVPCSGGQFIGDDCAGGSFFNIWFQFTAPTTGNYQIDTFGTSTDFEDTVLNVFSACQNDLDAVRIACNDDYDGEGDADNTYTSKVVVSLTAGQTVYIALGGYNTDDCGPAILNINLSTECCEPWDNGAYDGRDAQTSQVGYNLDWTEFGRVTADDFWLCEGNEYRIRTVRGTLCTNSVIPKAQVVILADCNGTPGRPVAFADSVRPDTTNAPLGTDCVIGTVEIIETGNVSSTGLRVIDVVARFDRLWLRGGYYWISFIGYSGNANPLDEFFWGTSGNNTVKGRPGKFFNSDDDSWTDIDLLCCGCTDFAFCIQGEECKILIDNGVPDYLFPTGFRPDPTANVAGLLGTAAPIAEIPGSPSLQNGTRTSDKVRTADGFVVPPCSDLELCYVQGWLITNCTRARLDLYEGSCHCPSEGPPVLSVESSCMTLVGRLGETGLDLYKVEFYDWKPVRLRAGSNYWVSVYALGDNRQNARGYFLNNFACDDPCLINFDPGCIKGAPYDTGRWNTVAPRRDFAFLVGVREPERDIDVVAPPANTCRADVNGDGATTVQDLFDFLAVFFAGCP